MATDTSTTGTTGTTPTGTTGTTPHGAPGADGATAAENVTHNDTSSQPTSERSLGQIVSDATTNAQSLVRDEIALAKAEIKTDAVRAGKGAGMFAAAGVLALYALGLLFMALAFVLALWLPTWAGFLIVSGVLFLIVGILALIGRSNVKKVKGKPEQAIAGAQRTQQTLTQAANPSVPTPRS